MSKRLFENRQILCPSCLRYVAHLTPQNLGKTMACKCGTKFQITSKVSDWEDDKNHKKGVSFTMGISAVVDNPVDRKNLENYNKYVEL